MHMVRLHRLGLPQESREAFTLLQQAGMLTNKLSNQMQAMVGFWNVAVHEYQKLSIPVVRSILKDHLDDFRGFSEAMIKQSS